MPSTPRARKRYAARNYSSPALPKWHTVTRGTEVPDDVQRFEGVPEPCFMCGAARPPCKHRVPA